MSLLVLLKRLTPPRVRQRLRAYLLTESVPEPPMSDNVAYNRYYWDRYAREWDNPAFDRDRPLPGSAAVDGVIGDEWGTPEDVDEIAQAFILSHVTSDSIVMEIGSGGGRIAGRVAPHVGELWCVDVSQEMLASLRKTLQAHDNVQYVLAPTPSVPAEVRGRLDFAYSFDVFVHLDLHTQWQYISAVATALRPGGRAFFHTANLTTENGWARFASQPYFTVGGYYFVSPEIVRTMLHRAGLVIVDEGQPSEAGYRAQDYLVLVERPAPNP